jgi:hypothetical protein
MHGLPEAFPRVRENFWFFWFLFSGLAMLAPFEASDLKIARAKKHLKELETEITAFFSANP